MDMFCKKLVLMGLGAAGALAVTNAVWSGSVATAWKQTKGVVSRQISPEFELERIRDQIAKLTPDMNKNIETIAEATVEVGALNRKIELVKAELDKRQHEILVLTEKVESGVKTVSLSGAKAKDKLVRDMKAYKSCEKDLASKQKLLEAKKESLDSARRQLSLIHEQRQELEAVAAEFEAELANLREAQARSKFKTDLDDSRLAQIKESFEHLRQRIDVERTKTELAGQFSNPATAAEPATAENTKDIVQDIRDYFGKKDSAQK